MALWRRAAPADDGSPAETAVVVSNQAADDVSARKLTLLRSRARHIRAGDDINASFSGALTMRAGGDMLVNGGGSAVMTAGRDLRLEGGGALIAVAREAHVSAGGVGVLLAGRAAVDPEARVLLTTQQALILGAAVGILYPLVRYLLNRCFPPPVAARRRPFWQRLLLWLGARVVVLGVFAFAIWFAVRRVRARVAGFAPAFLRGT